MNIIDANIRSNFLPALESTQVNPFAFTEMKSFQNLMKKRCCDRPINASRNVYNSEVIFDIPDWGYLTDLCINTTLATTADETNKEPYLGARIFKTIELRTKEGQKTLQRITPEYTQYRIDHLPYNLQTAVLAMTENDTVLNNNTLDYVTPLFLSCFDSIEKSLPCHFTEPLQLVCVINDSYGAMGLDNDITSLSFEIQSEFVILEEKAPVYLGNKYLSYDIYEEIPEVLTTSSTSQTIKLKTKDNIFNTVVIIKKAETQELGSLQSFNFISPNQTNCETSVLKNLLPWGWRNMTTNVNGNDTYGNSSVQISHSLTSDRLRNTGMINMEEMGQVKLELNYASIAADYSAYVFHEYWTIWEITPEGKVDVNRFSKSKKTPKQYVIDKGEISKQRLV